MRRNWLKMVVAMVLTAAGIGAAVLIHSDVLDLRHLNAHKAQLLSFVHLHYLEAASAFIGLYIASGLFLPGALVLTLAGGMLFGTLPAVLYVNIGATVGGLLAFLAGRYLLGQWVQGRFKEQLVRFNTEMASHGKNYLLVLRIFPIAPFFVINYCAGITKLPLSTFVWTTSLGILPGSVVHAFMGHQLRNLNAPGDLMSWKVLLALGLLSLFALLPVLRHHLGKKRGPLSSPPPSR